MVAQPMTPMMTFRSPNVDLNHSKAHRCLSHQRRCCPFTSSLSSRRSTSTRVQGLLRDCFENRKAREKVSGTRSRGSICIEHCDLTVLRATSQAMRLSTVGRKTNTERLRDSQVAPVCSHQELRGGGIICGGWLKLALYGYIATPIASLGSLRSSH